MEVEEKNIIMFVLLSRAETPQYKPSHFIHFSAVLFRLCVNQIHEGIKLYGRYFHTTIVEIIWNFGVKISQFVVECTVFRGPIDPPD